jgi:alpha-ketoglutarate-dependent taurine dioxygenase
MIQYKLHENGWTVILENFNIKDATQDDINQIARLLATNTCVVIKNQSLTIEDEVRIAKMFKNPQQFHLDVEGSFDAECYRGAEVDGSEKFALRVTGEKNGQGLPGIAGWEDEMVWHCNDPHDPLKRSLIWLYGVRGTAGSRTTWNNNILSYDELDEEKRKPLENLKLVMANWAEHDADMLAGYTGVALDGYTPNLVMENIAGRKGFYFPFLQISGFVGLSQEESASIISWLSEYTIQEKYCYHHDWQDGDIVIAEQWLGIHKRWPFKEIERRLLHRMAFDFPDQDYSI